jgi:aryl-alcohol dehydrogenase-like predicted oxidoreductase
MTETLPQYTLGRTGLDVTQLGFGSGGLRGDREADSDAHAKQVLNGVLDAGINFIDTAPDYGLSEERIGAAISDRRDEYFLATKCGCNLSPDGERLEPCHVWTADCLHRNIDQSLAHLKTDHVDLLQMHNPSVAEVQENGLIEALQEIRDAGKTRFIGVSSTAPHLPEFSRLGVFDTFQIPYSALERVHERMIQDAADAGAGIIIRGGMAKGHLDRGGRWEKWEQAGLDALLDGMSRYEFVLRFTLTHPACHTTIVATTNRDHLRANVAAAKAGPLSDELYREAARRLAAIGEVPAAGQ